MADDADYIPLFDEQRALGEELYKLLRHSNYDEARRCEIVARREELRIALLPIVGDGGPSDYDPPCDDDHDMTIVESSPAER